MCGGVNELVDDLVDDRVIEDLRGGGGGTGDSWEGRLCLIGGGGGTLEPWLGVGFCNTGGGGGTANGEEMGEEGCFTGVVRMGGGGGAEETILALCLGECWGTGGPCDSVGG